MDRNELKQRLDGLAYDCHNLGFAEISAVLSIIYTAVSNNQDTLLYGEMALVREHLNADARMRDAVKQYVQKNIPEGYRLSGEIRIEPGQNEGKPDKE